MIPASELMFHHLEHGSARPLTHPVIQGEVLQYVGKEQISSKIVLKKDQTFN